MPAYYEDQLEDNAQINLDLSPKPPEHKLPLKVATQNGSESELPRAAIIR